MQHHEKVYVQDVIEQLVGLAGVEAVDESDVDVDGALNLLTPEIEDASEEENAAAAMEASAEMAEEV